MDTFGRVEKLTTGATNSKTNGEGRIEFCRDRFLGPNAERR